MSWTPAFPFPNLEAQVIVSAHCSHWQSHNSRCLNTAWEKKNNAFRQDSVLCRLCRETEQPSLGEQSQVVYCWVPPVGCHHNASEDTICGSQEKPLNDHQMSQPTENVSSYKSAMIPMKIIQNTAGHILWAGKGKGRAEKCLQNAAGPCWTPAASWDVASSKYPMIKLICMLP